MKELKKVHEEMLRLESFNERFLGWMSPRRERGKEGSPNEI
jgi:hypothetical protein